MFIEAIGEIMMKQFINIPTLGLRNVISRDAKHASESCLFVSNLYVCDYIFSQFCLKFNLQKFSFIHRMSSNDEKLI